MLTPIHVETRFVEKLLGICIARGFGAFNGLMHVTCGVQYPARQVHRCPTRFKINTPFLYRSRICVTSAQSLGQAK